MRELRKAKWLTTGGGIICLATFLALSHNLPGKETRRMVAPSRVSGILRKSSAPILTAASPNNRQRY